MVFAQPLSLCLLVLNSTGETFSYLYFTTFYRVILHKGSISSPEIPLRLSTKQVLEFGIHGWFSIDMILSFEYFRGKYQKLGFLFLRCKNPQMFQFKMQRTFSWKLQCIDYICELNIRVQNLEQLFWVVLFHQFYLNFMYLSLKRFLTEVELF